LGGCAATSQVNEAVTTAILAKEKKSVALMIIGAEAGCKVVHAILGVAQKDGYRPVEVAFTRSSSPAESRVAEVELDPGEYHVVGYECSIGKHVHQLGYPKGGFFVNRFHRSYATFNIEAGEILNVGHVRVVPIGLSNGVDVAVHDWAPADLEKFRLQRPNLFAQMKTRLMVANKPPPMTAEQHRATCDRFRALQVDGKGQALPKACTELGGGPVPSNVAKTTKKDARV
jgi:hypothetical protein